MQYGSIGWSVGATLGYAQAAKDKRVIACIGDGSFQVSNIIRKESLYSEH
jgi:pyruvate decarboxylase